MAELDALLSQPAHGAVEVMKLDALGPLDLEVLFPPFCGAVASGIEQAMQDGEEDRPFHGKTPSSLGHLALDCSLGFPTAARVDRRQGRDRWTGCDEPGWCPLGGHR